MPGDSERMTEEEKYLRSFPDALQKQADDDQPPTPNMIAQARSILATIDSLRSALETEQMRLVACGVVAMADTPESAKKAREMHPNYRSASLGDVERRVDECITLRRDLSEARGALEPLKDAVACYEQQHADFLAAPSAEGLAAVNAERGAIVDAALAFVRRSK